MTIREVPTWQIECTGCGAVYRDVEDYEAWFTAWSAAREEAESLRDGRYGWLADADGEWCPACADHRPLPPTPDNTYPDLFDHPSE